MLKTQEEHRYKFHCPIRHPSRDTTKIRFPYISQVFSTKKWGKWHFCDAPLNFTVFDLNFQPRIWTARANKLKAGLFNFLLLSERYDRNNDPKKYKSDHNLSLKKEKKKTGFQFFCACGPSTRLNFQIENRKVERGIAEMPFSPFFCRKHLTYISNRILVVSLDGWRIGQ